MNITLEFTGIAKDITRQRQVSLSVETGATFTDLVKTIAQAYPGLVGVIINPEGTGLLNSNVFILNGEDLVLPDRMDQRINEGERLTLLSVIVGGNGF